MKITCPQCNATYNLPESRIPARKAAFTCKRCGKKVVINPEAGSKKAPQAITASQSRGPASSPAGAGQNSAIAMNFPEVKQLSPEHYALDRLLQPDKKGRYKTRRNTLKLKLLNAVNAPLNKILDQGEQVVHLAGAVAYYPAELLFGNGWLTMLYNRYVLVLTTQRLIAINTDYKIRKPTHYFFQFPYSEMKKISRGLFGSRLILTFKRGKRRIFNGIKASLSAEAKEYIDTKIGLQAGPDPTSPFQEYLCPGCFTPLGNKLASCPACGALFKSPRRAALRSLFLPGLGDFYLGHHFLGVCEMFGSLIVWMIFLSFLLSKESAGLVAALILLIFINGMDAFLTLHMAKKGYSLENKQSQIASRGRPVPIRAQA